MWQILAAIAKSGAAAASWAAEMSQAGSNIGVQSAYTPVEGASGAYELGGGGGLPQSTVPSNITQAGSKQVDVFGGQEYSKLADAAAQKAEPHIGGYIKNAMQNYARNKIGKRIAGKLDVAADVFNAFGDENKTELGQKVQEMSDWFYGSERKKRNDPRRERGLYAN
jgi:hypothetical protein